MAVYTKQTIITYQDTVDMIPEGWVNEAHAKSDEMALADKTSGEFDFLDMHSVKRIWVDQNAVDEWLTYTGALNTKYSVVVTNVDVSDITP